MNAHDFSVWLKGFLAASGDTLGEAQISAIKAQLDLVAPAAFSGQIMPGPFPASPFDRVSAPVMPCTLPYVTC